MIWLLALTQTIVLPVITAAIIASVAVAAGRLAEPHGLPRGVGAGHRLPRDHRRRRRRRPDRPDRDRQPGGQLSAATQEGATRSSRWAQDLGVGAGTAADANDARRAPRSAPASRLLTQGLLGGIDRLASLAVFLSFTALSLFFLLKDAPTIGGLVERHLGVPVPVAHAMLGRIAELAARLLPRRHDRRRSGAR